MLSYTQSLELQKQTINHNLLMNEIRECNTKKLFKKNKPPKQVKPITAPKQRGRPKLYDFRFDSKDPADMKKQTQYKYDKNKSYPPRHCNCCDKTIKYICWSSHIHSKTHIQNQIKSLLKESIENSENLGHEISQSN